MMTVRGWLRTDFRLEKADNSGKFAEGESVYRLCGVEIRHEAVSDRWYFDIKNDGRFMVREDLKKFVEEWSLQDYYPNTSFGMDSIVYRPKAGVAGTARFDPELNNSAPSCLRIEGVKNLELLREFYYAIRKGEADIDETWDGQGRNNLTQLTERIRALEEELSKAYTTIGTNQEYVGRVKRECDVMRGDNEQLREKLDHLCCALSRIWEENARVRLFGRRRKIREILLEQLPSSLNIIGYREELAEKNRWGRFFLGNRD